VLFQDDNLTLDKERARAIFAGMIDAGLGLSWTTPNGVALWAMDDDLLALMQQSGCYWLFFAIESGDPDTLAHIIHKPLRLDRIPPLIATCRKLKIRTTAFFVVGLPGETLAAMQRSLHYAEDLDVDSIAVFIAAPYPGTPLYSTCLEHGYLVQDFTFSKLTTRFGQIATPDFSPADVTRLVNRTLLRRSLKHPWGMLRRAWDKLRSSPVSTLRFIWQRASQLIFTGHGD